MQQEAINSKCMNYSFLNQCNVAHWKILCFRCPILFERASRNWWKPEFDSKILENQFLETYFLQVKSRYQYALVYIMFICLSWMIYFIAFTYPNWIPCTVSCILAVLMFLVFLALTFSSYYRQHIFLLSISTVFIFCALSLASFANYYEKVHNKADITIVAIFSICIETILVIYILIPIPLHLSFMCCSLYSFLYELLFWQLVPQENNSLILIRIFLHICTHLIGSHILIMSEARARSTFFKVGQSLLVRKDLQIERKLKEKMVYSVMPPKVANWLLPVEDNEEENIEFIGMNCHNTPSPRPLTNNLLPVFRPFNMHRMENVSILYADIVGFTKMSSNKSAEQLVGLLNDLFARFDDLCTINGCEKIATLGDCYYCVSGCPEPKPDHAKCCVEMGFGMIKAIKKFDEDRNEQVDMRVGVHTGTVLCGIVGICRFKFDVWSNDVSFANIMESTGKPGMIHVSEITLSFINEDYENTEGETIQGIKTYFITERKCNSSTSHKLWHSYPVVNQSLSEIETQLNFKNQLDKPQSDNEEDPLNTTSCIIENSPKIKVTLHSLPGQTVTSHSLTTLNSRKDSGIRSDHSSLPDITDNCDSQQEGIHNHRISGYYTSSLPSVNDAEENVTLSFQTYFPETNELLVPSGSFCVNPSLTLNESLARLGNFRKQSDLQIIKCIQKDLKSMDRLVKSPISPLSLFFLDSAMEKQYRKNAYNCDKITSKHNVASPAFNLYYDMFVSTIVFYMIAFSSFFLFHISTLWIVFFIMASIFQVFVIVLCIQHACFSEQTTLLHNTLQRLFYFVCTRWKSWHIFGVILSILPLLSVFFNFCCDKSFIENTEKVIYFCHLSFVSLIHLFNFTRLNCWIKLLICVLSSLFLFLLFGLDICVDDDLSNFFQVNETSIRIWKYSMESFETPVPFFYNDKQFSELILSVMLLVFLVGFLNREFEISYRSSFHANHLTVKDKAKVQAMKNQAEMLLHNIIPKHVASQLKINSKYSENHRDVGIIFVSITNFNEMYDESYEGGKEYLRVLNELVGDYDELLSKKEFRNVEKIKTIGSTFMAASGMNPTIRKENVHPMQHLFELMDFAIAMQKVIDNFNINLLEFDFTLRIGYNFGDVTAGVIGTTKLFYDIWGDAVNIASRMDSTGVVGEIQVPESCVPVLQEVFEFKFREKIFVKGKNEMNVYLLKERKNIDYHNQEELCSSEQSGFNQS